MTANANSAEQFPPEQARDVLAIKADVAALEDLSLASTITAAGQTGNKTINKPVGAVNIAALGTTVTVTNSFCTVDSVVLCVLRTADATAVIGSVVPGAGSFVITLSVATTAETSIGFVVMN